MMDQAMGQGAVRGSAPRSCWAWRRRHRGGRRTASAGASPDFNQLPSVIHPGVQPVASHVESQRSVNRIVAGQLAQRARALSDEDLQRHFEDLLDAKSEGSRTASAIVEEQVAAIEAEEERPTAWDDVSGSGRESLAFRTEAPSDPQPEDQGLRDADVRAEEDNRVPLAEETFAASASPPKESNSDTVGAFVKEHLVSFELAGGGGGCLCPRHRRLTPSRLRSRQQNPLKKSPHRSRGIVGRDTTRDLQPRPGVWSGQDLGPRRGAMPSFGRGGIASTTMVAGSSPTPAPCKTTTWSE
mmetsp:Transcript_9623/g.34367  ORF Transcript_9623/g.34367 Transcript_9623/m.34367 type:complete len:298 (+) Transcript_9623:26-919(+)